MASRRPGFTLIEILVAMTIILVLLGLAVVGMRHLSQSSKTKATRVTLDSAKAMLAEYERAVKTENLPTGSVRAPGFVTVEQGAKRYYGAVLSTRSFMAKMRGTQVVRSSLEKIPADQLHTWTWSATNPAPPSTVWSAGTNYLTGARVSHVEGAVTKNYVAVGDHLSAVVNEPPSALWAADSATANEDVPVLLDAWGNPIIFVPRGGLTGVYLKSTPTGTLPGAVTVTSKGIGTINRGFFASAGPDGIFGRDDAGPDGLFGTGDDITGTHVGGDDNLYSFEN